MKNTILQVIEWAEERNIVYGSNIENETLKLMSTSGKLTNFVDEKDICIQGIGDAIIQMIILCQMKGDSIHEGLKFIRKIKDERIIDPQFSLIMIMKYMGELAGHIYHKNDIRTDIGYLLVYMTALGHSLELPLKECIARAFRLIKDDRYIMFDGSRLDETDDNYGTAKRIIDAARTKLGIK